MSSNIDHPTHYNIGQIEVIDFIEAWNFPFHLANAIKYIARAEYKNPELMKEDLEKAIWYLQRYIEFKDKEKKKE